MKKSVKAVLISILVLVIGLIAYLALNTDPSKEETPISLPTPDEQTPSTENSSRQPPLAVNPSNQKIESLLHFIQTDLTDQHGVFTNYQPSKEDQDVATGHEVLSESAGFMMAYAASAQMKELFQQELIKMQQTFDNDQLFGYRYSPLKNKLYPVNAAVDDLRIIRILDHAAKVFDEPSWQALSQDYAKRFSQTNLNDDQLIDFYDSQLGLKNQQITLCYIDLSALALLPLNDKKQEQLLQTQATILANGYLSDDFPLYETRYNYETKAYEGDTINIVESLMTILHLVRQEKAQPASLEYLKRQTPKGQLYNRFTREGKSLDHNQSTATYALVAIIAARIGDVDFYRDAIQQMETFRVTDNGSAFYGAFGDPNSQTFYSFDNLLALLAYQANPTA